MNASASTAENEARQAASLRRIAIVLRDLPEGMAPRLLAELGPQARARVRHELANLVDVDPMERKRALESFTGSLKRQAARREDDRDGSQSDYESGGNSTVDELSLRSASYPSPRASDRFGDRSQNDLGSTTPVSEPSRLAFLDQVTDEDLMEIMSDEHPQTKAVVLASIEPARAARLLPRLGGAQRQDMLSRIGRLQILPDEMLADLASSFRERVQKIQAKNQRNPLQQLIDQNAIDLQADGTSASAWDPAQAAQHVPARAAAVSPRLQAILSEMPSSRSATHTEAKNAEARDPQSRQTSYQTASGDEAASDAAERLRRITRDEASSDPHNELSGHRSATAEPRNRAVDPAPPRKAPSLSTHEVHEELIRMPARRLCEALGRVDTRVAILALCGLPNETADAAIACLPRAQANQVRQHLMSVGSMEIREIDHAKDEVAHSARSAGTISSSATAASVTGASATHSSISSGQESRRVAA